MGEYTIVLKKIIFRAIKICIKAHYPQAVLLSDRILIRVVKIQTKPLRDFWQSEKLLWV